MPTRHHHLLDAASVSTVTLLDGTQVDSASEAWRHECLAREVARWPLHKRRDYVAELERKRPEAAQALKKTLKALWQTRTQRTAS